MACVPGDFGCYLGEALVLLTPYIFSIILVLIAIFILPKAGYKGVVLAVVLILGVAWFWGLIPGIPSLRSLLGLAVLTRG